MSGGQSHGQPTGGPAPHEDLGGGPCLLRLPYQKPQTEWLTVYFLQLWGLASVTHVRKSPWASFMGTAMCFRRPFCSSNHPITPYPNTVTLMITIAEYTLGSGRVHYNYYRAIRTTKGISMPSPHTQSCTGKAMIALSYQQRD